MSLLEHFKRSKQLSYLTSHITEFASPAKVKVISSKRDSLHHDYRNDELCLTQTEVELEPVSSIALADYVRGFCSRCFSNIRFVGSFITVELVVNAFLLKEFTEDFTLVKPHNYAQLLNDYNLVSTLVDKWAFYIGHKDFLAENLNLTLDDSKVKLVAKEFLNFLQSQPGQKILLEKLDSSHPCERPPCRGRYSSECFHQDEKVLLGFTAPYTMMLGKEFDSYQTHYSHLMMLHQRRPNHLLALHDAFMKGKKVAVVPPLVADRLSSRDTIFQSVPLSKGLTSQQLETIEGLYAPNTTSVYNNLEETLKAVLNI